MAERALHPPAGQQRPLRVRVGVDEPREHHAARRQADHLTVPRRNVDVPHGGDRGPVDQHIRPLHGVPMPSATSPPRGKMREFTGRLPSVGSGQPRAAYGKQNL